MNLANRIAAVHVIYSSIHEELHWFGQLTSQYPGIVSSLSQMSSGEEGMVGVIIISVVYATPNVTKL